MSYSADYNVGRQAGQKDAYHEVFDSMMGFALDHFDSIMHETFVVNDRIDDATDYLKSEIDDIKKCIVDIKNVMVEIKDFMAINNDSIDNLYDKIGDIEVKIGMKKEEE